MNSFTRIFKVFIEAKIFTSFKFFLSLQFIDNKKYDVFLIYPSHFNRDGGVNIFFSNILKTLQKFDKSFIVFEDYSPGKSYPRDSNSIPFDFITFTNGFFNKIFKISKIKKIDKFKKFLNKFFFRNISAKNIITISKSFLNEFLSIYQDVNVYDLQHGVIHKKHCGYLDFVNENKNYSLFLFGDIYKSEIPNYSKTIDNRLIVLGHPYYKKEEIYFNQRKFIIYTSNFSVKAEDGSELIDLDKEIKILKEIHTIIRGTKFEILFKPHPRSKIFNEIVFDGIKIRKINKDIRQLLNTSFLHVTSFSSSVFDFSAFGVPTVFYTAEDNPTIFKIKDFNYPLSPSESFNKTISKYIEDFNLYKYDCNNVYEWYWNNHSQYSESTLIGNLNS